MKRYLCFLLCAMIQLAPLALVVSCAGFGKTAYRTTSTAQITVEHAMSAWNDWVGTHHPGVDAETKVANALSKYKAESLAVIDTAQAYAKARDDAAMSAFNASIAAASTALNDLIGILTSYGVKL